MKYFLALSLLLSGLSSYVSGLSVQSGPESGADSVAGGINFDPIRNVLYVTGATNGSFFGEADPTSTNCFLGVINVETPETPWLVQRQLGNENVPEACFSLTRMGNTDDLFIAGAALEGGILSELRAPGSLKATVYGMIMQMSLAATNADNVFSSALEGGKLLHEDHVEYPIAMDSDTEHLYVASIISGDVSENPNYEPFSPQSYGYGSDFSVKVQRFQMEPAFQGDDSLQETLRASWQREIGTSSSVFVGGLLYMSGSSLILAGATAGSDSAFPDSTQGDDFDGFVTEIDPSSPTGELTSKSYRIESQPDRDDRVYGVCKQEGAESEFYVVGMTKGNLDSTENRNPEVEQAFIMKIEVVTSRGFTKLWHRQVGAEGGAGSNGVQGMACAVTDDGKDVYLVGRVDSEAKLSGTDQESAGGADVFVMQLDAAQGTPKYIKQLGSPGDDYVTDVVTDKNGNALVYGTTTGSLYRDNTELEQDIFLLSVARADGAFDPPINGGPGTVLTPPSEAATTDLVEATTLLPPSDESDIASMSPSIQTSQVPSMTTDPVTSDTPTQTDPVTSDTPTQMTSIVGTEPERANDSTSGRDEKKGYKITIVLTIASMYFLLVR